MASELIVQTLKGPTSGANANKVIIPSGQTLDASAGGMTLPAGVGGKVLQVVQGTKSTSTNSTSSTFASTGLTATITPTSASSKVLVMVSLPMYLESQTTASSRGNFRVLRGTTDITGDLRGIGLRAASGVNSYVTHSGIAVINYLDSPNATIATTYTVEHRSTRTDSATVVVSFVDNSLGTIQVMEIAG